jgi:hypothetical protein
MTLHQVVQCLKQYLEISVRFDAPNAYKSRPSEALSIIGLKETAVSCHEALPCDDLRRAASSKKKG